MRLAHVRAQLSLPARPRMLPLRCQCARPKWCPSHALSRPCGSPSESRPSPQKSGLPWPNLHQACCVRTGRPHHGGRVSWRLDRRSEGVTESELPTLDGIDNESYKIVTASGWFLAMFHVEHTTSQRASLHFTDPSIITTEARTP